jgi:hypothetical protein
MFNSLNYKEIIVISIFFLLLRLLQKSLFVIPEVFIGNPVFLLNSLVPRLRGDDVWIPAGVYPVLDTGRA